MTAIPGRRQILQAGAAATFAGVLTACTAGRPSPPTSSRGPTTSGSASSTRSPAPTYTELAAQLGSALLLAGRPGYDAGSLLYNPRFAAQAPPQAIAACRHGDDVAACVRFAAAGGAALRIRNGGHSYGGWSSGSGLVADLAAIDTVAVDPTAMTATVGAGARLVGVYTALAAQGVSLGAGSCPTVGVTGLTLGGGVGVLGRAYGLSCDQVRSFQVVTADGRIRTVDAQHDPDLFWALRGGGGGFAAVTSLTFAVRPAPTVTRFFLSWPLTAAAEVLAAWQQWIAGVPRELWSTCKLLADPGTGTQITVSGTWIGSGPLQNQLQGLLHQTPAPATDYVTTGSYGETMLAEAGCAGQDAGTCVAAALAPAKRQPFAATSAIMTDPLPDAGIAAIVAAVAAGLDVPDLVEGGVSFDSAGGAVADVAPAATAYPWRAALATVQYTATWSFANAAIDPTPFDAFVRGERAVMQQWFGTSAYVNYADASITDFGAAYWGPNLPRLQQVRRTYDPDGVFSFPQAVPT